MPNRTLVRGLWLGLLLGSACYRWNVVPEGVEQRTLDLRVGTLLQHYTVLSPKQPEPLRKRQPAVVLLHSGFGGDESSAAELGRRLCSQGLTVILPAYRGQVRKLDGKRSDGDIEFCLGEVDDAQAALQWLTQQPGVDPTRIGVMGSSHGGCIALRLGERGVTLRALVTMSAPVAADPLVRYLQDQPARTFFYNGILGEQIQSWVKSSPQESPQAYLDRSPLFGVERLKMPMMMVHGTADSIVPVEQACLLAFALRASGRTVRVTTLDPEGIETTDAASPCTPMLPATSRVATPSPASAASPRTELVFLDKQNHIYGAKSKRAAQDLAVEFLLRELTAPPP